MGMRLMNQSDAKALEPMGLNVTSGTFAALVRPQGPDMTVRGWTRVLRLALNIPVHARTSAMQIKPSCAASAEGRLRKELAATAFERSGCGRGGDSGGC